MYESMQNMMGGGYGWGIFGMLFMVAFSILVLVLLVLAIMWLAKQIGK